MHLLLIISCTQQYFELIVCISIFWALHEMRSFCKHTKHNEKFFIVHSKAYYLINDTTIKFHYIDKRIERKRCANELEKEFSIDCLFVFAKRSYGNFNPLFQLQNENGYFVLCFFCMFLLTQLVTFNLLNFA